MEKEIDLNIKIKEMCGNGIKNEVVDPEKAIMTFVVKDTCSNGI